MILGPLFLLWWLPDHLEVRELKRRSAARQQAPFAPTQRDHGRGPLPAPGVHSVSSRDTVLVLLRKAEWMLDEVAFEVGGGRYRDQQRRELATALD